MCAITDNTNKHKKASQGGFTLIEMAIVISIVGLIIASAGTAYVQWQTWLRYETTQDNVQRVHEAVEGFLATNGRYPCPASLAADRNNGTLYGLEPNIAGFTCDDNIAADVNFAATAGVDIYLVDGARDIAHVRNDGSAGADPNVRIGMIPFRALGLDEDVAFDGYRNRIYYAVTDHMTSSDGFDNGMTGAIRVEDDDGNPLTNDNDVHFLVFSAGENGAGAYTREGAQLPCPGAGNAENENCDLDDAVFTLGSYSTALGANAMDDTMVFGVSSLPFFQRPDGGDLNDGVTKSALNLGIGGVADDPQEELDIAGIVRAQAPEDDPATTDVDESELGGKIEAAELCANGSDTDCFNIEVIAGNVGIGCTGAGIFMKGIQNNTEDCGPITTGCPDEGDYIVGIDSDGNAECATASANPPCPTTQVDLCGIPQTLAAGTDTQTRTITAGDSRSQTFTCESGTWKAGNATGLCTCTATNPYTGTIPCAVNNNTCGPRYTGTQDAQITAVTCPSGNSSTTILDDSRCVCDPTSKRTGNRKCEGANNSWLNLLDSKPPSGFSYNTGRIYRENVTICPAAACSGWQLDRENCGCTNKTQTQTQNCQNGLSGKRTRTRDFTCVGGGGLGDYGKRGNWSAWDESNCTCDTSGVTDGLIQCHKKKAGWVPKPGGPGGIRTETSKIVNGSGECVSQTVELDSLTDVCDPPPPVQCAWEAGGSSAPGSHPTNFAGVPGGCTCGSPNAPCEQGSLRFNSCSCNPI